MNLQPLIHALQDANLRNLSRSLLIFITPPSPDSFYTFKILSADGRLYASTYNSVPDHAIFNMIHQLSLL